MFTSNYPQDKAGNVLSVGDKIVSPKHPETEPFEIIDFDTMMRTVTVQIPVVKATYRPFVDRAIESNPSVNYETRVMTYESIIALGHLKVGSPAAEIAEEEVVKKAEQEENETDFIIVGCICGNRFSHLNHIVEVHCNDCGRADKLEGGNNWFTVIK